MSFSFHPDAEIEFQASIDYYEEVHEGLGYEFAAEVFAAIKRAENIPKAWVLLDDNIRRSLTARFPYGVLYSEENTGIYILAIMHLHRQPDYWKVRN